MRAMMKIGHAAVHHESAIFRHVCCACYAMGLGDICIDQLNRTCIFGEHGPSRCLRRLTDLDKDGDCCLCYIPWLASMVARGLTASSAPRPMSQLQVFLLKEDDSTNGDLFLASKFKQSPKRGGRRTRNLSNGVRHAARPSWQIWNLFFSKIQAHNCPTPQTRGRSPYRRRLVVCKSR